jgi:hypothetical protein
MVTWVFSYVIPKRQTDEGKWKVFKRKKKKKESTSNLSQSQLNHAHLAISFRRFADPSRMI